MSALRSDPPKPEWRWSDPSFEHVASVDPEVEWALGPGREVFFPRASIGPYGPQRRWMPVAIELKGISVKDFAQGTAFLDDGPSRAMWQASVRVSPLHSERQDSRTETAFCTAMVTPGFFEFLRRNEKLSKIVIGVTLSLPLGTESLGPSLSTNNSGLGQP
jgi:hypothetical protein